MRRSVSQIFTSPTPQAEHKLRELESQAREKGMQERERDRTLFLKLQGRRPTIQSSFSSTPLQPQPQSQHPFTYTYEPPRSRPQPRSQIEALPPNSTSSSPTSLSSASTTICEGNLERQVKEFMELQRKRERDPARTHPMFFTDLVKRAPNGVLVGEGIGSGYVFEEGRRNGGGEGRGML